MDYDYNHDYYLLAKERDRLGLGDFRVSDHPFQRRPSITDFYNPTQPAYLVWGAVTCGRRRYDPEEYQSPDNKYYRPPCATSTSPLCQVCRTWRCYSSSRSKSGSPQPRCPPSPQVSSPPGTPPSPYSPSVGSCSPTSNQGGPSIVRSKTRDLPSILVTDTPQWKTRFKKVPDLHKRFLMEVYSLILNTAELAQFAKSCGISEYTASRAAMDNLGNDGECIEQALCRWWMSSNTHPHHKAYKVKLGFDQLDCPGLFGTLLDRYPEWDPRGDEAVAAAEPLLGPSSDPSYDGDNGEKLHMDSHLWREECSMKWKTS